MAYIQKDRVEAREAYKKLATSQKIGHLWHYYKWHVIITLFVVISATTIIHGIVTRIHPDLTVLYLTRQHVPREHIVELEEYFALHIEDVNNDGRNVVSIIQISFDLNQPSQENMVQLQRMQTQLSTGDVKLFIVDDMFLERLEELHMVELYAPIGILLEYPANFPPDLFVVKSVEYAQNARGRHAERHQREHENAERIFRLLMGRI